MRLKRVPILTVNPKKTQLSQAHQMKTLVPTEHKSLRCIWLKIAAYITRHNACSTFVDLLLFFTIHMLLVEFFSSPLPLVESFSYTCCYFSATTCYSFSCTSSPICNCFLFLSPTWCCVNFSSHNSCCSGSLIHPLLLQHLFT